MIKRILSLVLALLLCGCAAIAEDDLQSQLDAANARIAELEAEVAQYKPFYDAQVVISFDGGVIFVDEVLEEYAYIADMYSQYGISLADYGLEEQFKQQAADALLNSKVLYIKAAELGLDQLDDETMATLTEEAAANLETYIEAVLPNFTGDDVSDEDARADAIAYLESMGYTQDDILQSLVTSVIDENLYNYITKDVAVTEDDIQAAYDSLLVSQQETFTTESAYNSGRDSGEPIVWHPEGYRAVKHVLIMFSDEQYTAYKELNSTMTTLNAELAALSEESDDSETESRSAEEIQADIDACQAELDALYAALMPEAQAVIDAFNAGTSFADLIAEYGDDPGMTNEPNATIGYAVNGARGTWDPAFSDGAMSIESVGGISEPVFGMNGIHIIYYESDIPAGPVALADVHNPVSDYALDLKTTETYSATLASWVAALNPVYTYSTLVG